MKQEPVPVVPGGSGVLHGTVRKTKKTWKFRVLFVVLQAEI